MSNVFHHFECSLMGLLFSWDTANIYSWGHSERESERVRNEQRLNLSQAFWDAH